MAGITGQKFQAPCQTKRGLRDKIGKYLANQYNVPHALFESIKIGSIPQDGNNFRIVGNRLGRDHVSRSSMQNGLRRDEV
jgi:hypothetical protein